MAQAQAIAIATAEEAAFDWKKPNYDPIYRKRAEWLTHLRANPDVLAGVHEFYKDHPVDFITDWGMTFDPRNVAKGLPTTVPFVLFPRQEEFLDWLLALWRASDDGLAEKSRDMGITWLCTAFAVWMWRYQPESVSGFGSRKEDLVDRIGDPDSIFWKIRTYINLLPVEFRPNGYDEKEHAPFMRIINPENGAVIRGEAGNNIGRGGRTSIYFKDESAHYEHAGSIDAALSQTSNCKIDLSTPNGPGNAFYKKRHGGKVKVFTFNWRQDPRKDQAWYQKQVDTLDEVIVAQEIDINYEASMGDAFVPGELVDRAQKVKIPQASPSGPVQFGVDCARFGDDKTVITCRRGRALLFQRVHKKIDVVDAANYVITEVEAFDKGTVRQIAVDTIGIGAGVADILRRKYPAEDDDPSIVVDVNCSLPVNDGTNANIRAQMYDNGREWLKQTPCSLPDDSDLKTDLTALKYKFKGGVRFMEDKADAKKRGVKSPDRADSLMLTFAYPCLPPKPSPTPLPVFEQNVEGMGMLG